MIRNEVSNFINRRTKDGKMTVYTKTMAQALREVYLVEDNMEQMRKAAGGAMQTIKFRDCLLYTSPSPRDS